MPKPQDPNGRFIVAAVDNPKGFKPGLYYYAMHLATGRKVSKLERKPASAFKRASKYARRYAAGDRYWPEVSRLDELFTNDNAVPTFMEAASLTFGFYPLF